MSPEKVAQLGLLMAAGFALLIAWLLLSIVYRFVTGKGLAGHAPHDATFVDIHAYGRSLRSELTQAKGVTFPLIVAITEAELIVRPRFPATLFFMPEIFDLQHRVPLEQIKAQLARDSWSRPAVHLAWHDRRDNVHQLELHLRHGHELVEARDRLEAPIMAASASAA